MLADGKVAPVEDVVARAVAVAGLAVAIGGIALTWWLWRRSGPAIRVSAFVRLEHGGIHIEVASTGRLTVTVRQLELRDHLVLRTSRERYETVPTSRWTMAVDLKERRPGQPTNLPIDLGPTAYVEADVPIGEVMKYVGTATEASVAAWAQRGDGKWISSKPIRIR